GLRRRRSTEPGRSFGRAAMRATPPGREAEMGNVETGVLTRPAHIGEAEWRLRLDLAAAYRVFDWYGWNETIFNHITVRVPGPERHFLINPFGLWYDEVTA